MREEQMKILVAEDDSITSHLLQALLTKAGYQPIAVDDGAQVLEMLDQPDRPRLMILDWMMPNVDGVEVCRAIRRNNSDHYVYLILLTVKGKQEEIVEGLEAGADDYVTKPFDFHELVARLRTGKRILELQDQLLIEATHDSLTGLLNRDAILDILRKESERALRSKSPLAVIMADIDHFKQINDTYGHLAGDAVLRGAAERMLGSIRSYDAVGRYGGEEFLIVAPGCDASDGAHMAERFRNSFSESAIDALGRPLSLTMSFGVADTSVGPKQDEILRAADIALYAAKRAGRNRVEICSQVKVPS
jgi:two-component system, cell cycle response regulator